ncbi:non-ribosomal peptide synthetase [Streptomyces sp. NPDC050759]|uniref:non-ribosomal peptide synthetase n=1 Tax=Streptomyces sp. NPDC050759 TaxID=3365635 RepID=UPI0037A39883
MSTTSPHTPDKAATSPGQALLSVEYGAAHGRAPVGRSAILGRYGHWVERTPRAPAVIEAGGEWSYGQLDALADRIAAALRGRVGPGDLVAVSLEHSAALVAVWVAVARLDAVCLPLGPRPGEQRLNAVLDEVRPACLIGERTRLAGRADDAAQAVPLPVTPPWADAEEHDGTVAVFLTPERHPTVPEEAFYVVLTSGSTGGPKAVVVGGVSFDALLLWYCDRTASGPGDRHSMLIGGAFDPHPKEVWAALTSGAALVIPPETVRSDPHALTTWWQDAGISLSILPTPLAELVLGRPWPALPRLRHLEIGGDRLRSWPAPEVTAQVHNAYGPAEATVLTTVHRLDPAAEDTGVQPPIGLPMDGAVVWVTDDAGRVVPRGEAGELRIGGTCLALGYLDKGLTAEYFVPPPAGVTGTDRVYRTGDRVRMRADGVLEFLGRLDDQVKISGVRIEPAEVEAALERTAQVARAVVVPQRVRGLTRLLAFVQPLRDAAAPDPALTLEEVRALLPEQAVPSSVVILDAFPLDANGKVDRAALSAMARPPERTAGAAPAQEEASPADESALAPLEKKIVAVTRDLLDNPDLSLHDHLTDAGMTSLVAAHLLHALEELTGVRFSAAELLRQPDLRGILALATARPPAGLRHN